MAATEWTPVYFHSKITSHNVALVVECILATEARDGTPAGQQVGVGWAIINAFGGEARSTAAPVPGDDDAVRAADAGLDNTKGHRYVDVFTGSPRTLALNREASGLHKIADSRFQFSLFTHTAGRMLCDLIEEDVAVGALDPIPGLQHVPVPATAAAAASISTAHEALSAAESGSDRRGRLAKAPLWGGSAPAPAGFVNVPCLWPSLPSFPSRIPQPAISAPTMRMLVRRLVVSLPPFWEGRLLAVLARSHATVLGLLEARSDPGKTDLVGLLGMHVVRRRLVLSVHNGRRAIEEISFPLAKANQGSAQAKAGSLAPKETVMLLSSISGAESGAGADKDADDGMVADAAKAGGGAAAARAGRGRGATDESGSMALDSLRLDPLMVLRVRLEVDVVHPLPPKDGRPALPGLVDGGSDECIRTVVVGVQEYPPFDGRRLHVSNRPDPAGASVTGRSLELPLRGAYAHSRLQGAVWSRDWAEFALESEHPLHRPRIDYSAETNPFVGMDLQPVRLAGPGGRGTRVVYLDGARPAEEAEQTPPAEPSAPAAAPAPVEDEEETRRLRAEVQAANDRAQKQQEDLDKALADIKAAQDATGSDKDAVARMEADMRRLMDQQQQLREAESTRLRKERERADERWRARLAAEKAKADASQRQLEEELKRLRDEPKLPATPAPVDTPAPSRAGSASHLTTPRDASEHAEEMPGPGHDTFGAVADVLTRPITPPVGKGPSVIVLGHALPTSTGRGPSDMPGPRVGRLGFCVPLTSAERALLAAHGYSGTADRPTLEALTGVSDLYVAPAHLEPELSDPNRATRIRICLAALVPTRGGIFDPAMAPDRRASFVKKAAGADAGPTGIVAPSRVYATFQLYTCTPTRTSPLVLVPAADSSGPADPVAAPSEPFGRREGVVTRTWPRRPRRAGDAVDVDSKVSEDAGEAATATREARGQSPQTTYVLMSQPSAAAGAGSRGSRPTHPAAMASAGHKLAPAYEFLIDPSASHPGDAVAFAEYLATAQLHIELWDADSHLPLGVARLALRSLLRQQRRLVTSGRAVDVLSVDPAAPGGAVTSADGGPSTGFPGPSESIPASALAPAAGSPGSRVCTLHVLLSSQGQKGAGTFDAPPAGPPTGEFAARLPSSAGTVERGEANLPGGFDGRTTDLQGRASALSVPPDTSTASGRRALRKTKVTVEARRLRIGGGRDLDDLLRAAGAGRTAAPRAQPSPAGAVQEVEDAPTAGGGSNDPMAGPSLRRSSASARGGFAAPGSISDPASLSLKETRALRGALGEAADEEGLAVDPFVDLVYGGPGSMSGIGAAMSAQQPAAWAQAMPGASVEYWSSAPPAVPAVGGDRWSSIPSRPPAAVDGLLAAALRAAAAPPGAGRDGSSVEDGAVLRLLDEAAAYAQEKRATRRRFLDDKAIAQDASLEATATALERAGKLHVALEPLQAATAFTAAEASVDCSEDEMTAGRLRHTLAARAGVHLTDDEFHALLQRHAPAAEEPATPLTVVSHAKVAQSILRAGDAADEATAKELALADGSGDVLALSGAYGGRSGAVRLPAEVVVACGKVRTLVRMVLSTGATAGEKGSLRGALLEMDDAGTGRVTWASWKRVLEKRLGLRVVLRAGDDPFDAAMAERQLRRAMAVERSLRAGEAGVLGAASPSEGAASHSSSSRRRGAGTVDEEAEEAAVRAAAIRALAAGTASASLTAGAGGGGAALDPEATLLQLYREGRKRDLVTGILAQAITHSLSIYPCCGRACLLQLTIRNPFPHEERVRVAIDDPTGARELRLVTDTAEWAFLRSVLPLAAADPGAGLIESGAATGAVVAGSVTAGGHAMLAPMESVTLGFVFVSFATGIVRGAPGSRALPVGGADAEAAARAMSLRSGRTPTPAEASVVASAGLRSAPFSDLALASARSAAATGRDVATQSAAAGGSHPALAPRTIAVRVLSTSHGSALSVLRCSVCPRPYPIHKTLRFFQAEASTLTARLRLPSATPEDGGGGGWSGDAGAGAHGISLAPGLPSLLPGSASATARSLRGAFAGSESAFATTLVAPGQFVHCADARVVCESRNGPSGREMVLRVRAGPFPEAKDFLLFLYNDPFCASMHQCWRVVVHSVLHCDISSGLNARADLELVIRSDGRARRVSVASTLPLELWCPMAPPIGLAGGAYNRVRLAFRPLAHGHRRALVHATDVDTGALVCAWQVGTTASAPVISKEYDLTVRVDRNAESMKKLTYTNVWPEQRLFSVSTDRPDLVLLRDRGVALDAAPSPGSTGFVRLALRPCAERGSAEALLFVESKSGGLEEVLLLRIAYV